MNNDQTKISHTISSSQFNSQDTIQLENDITLLKQQIMKEHSLKKEDSYHVDVVGEDIQMSSMLIVFVTLISVLVGLCAVANLKSLQW